MSYHLSSCQCSECEIARGQAAVPPPPSSSSSEVDAQKVLRSILGPLDPQVEEIVNSPAYVICIGGVPLACVLGGNSEFAMQHIAGGLVFSLADDAELPNRVDVQIFAVALRGQNQIVLALNDLTNADELSAAIKSLVIRAGG